MIRSTFAAKAYLQLLRGARRRALQLEHLEDRTTPTAASFARPYAMTDIVARIEINAPTTDLSQHTNLAALEGVDLSTTQSLGGNLMKIGLQPGTDVAATIARVEKLPYVRWASPDYLYTIHPELTPNDTYYSQQTNLTKISVNTAWDALAAASKPLGSTSTIVAVLDDGVAFNHPDLAANIWTNPGEIAGDGIDNNDTNTLIDDIHGWDFTGTPNANVNPRQSQTHGTEVAGVIAAVTNNATGIAGIAGGNNGTGGVKIMPLRVVSVSDTNTNMLTSSIIADALSYATVQGAKIVNISLETDRFATDPTFSSALNTTYDAGVLIVGSGGNDNKSDAERAVFNQILFAGSTNAADVRSNYSDYGPWMDISAPAENIVTLGASAGGASFFTTDSSNVQNPPVSGTSFAAPQVAGVAALIWAQNPTWTRDQVAARLLGGTDNLDTLNPTYAGQLGTGRLNALKPLTVPLAAPKFGTITGLPAEASTVKALSTFQITVPFRFDATRVNAAAFELRTDGPDNLFGTADDSVIPLAINSTDAGLTGAAYRIGTNTITIEVAGVLTPDHYQFTARSGGVSGLCDPFGVALDGNGDGTAGGRLRPHLLRGRARPRDAGVRHRSRYRHAVNRDGGGRFLRGGLLAGGCQRPRCLRPPLRRDRGGHRC